MPNLRLLGAYGASCTRRVLTVLYEKGAEFEFQEVQYFQGAHKTPEYLEKHHPFGQIPTLYDGDFRVFESRAIARYVDDVTSGTKLVPTDPKLKALVEQWISVEMCHFRNAETIVEELVFKQFFSLPPDPVVVEKATERLHAFLVVLNKHLEGKTFLVGEVFTLAGRYCLKMLTLLLDITYLPFMTNILRIPAYSNLLTPYPNVESWWKRITSRPSWQKVLSLVKQ